LRSNAFSELHTTATATGLAYGFLANNLVPETTGNKKKGNTITITPKPAVVIAQAVSHTEMAKEELSQAERDGI